METAVGRRRGTRDPEGRLGMAREDETGRVRRRLGNAAS